MIGAFASPPAWTLSKNSSRETIGTVLARWLPAPRPLLAKPRRRNAPRRAGHRPKVWTAPGRLPTRRHPIVGPGNTRIRSRPELLEGCAAAWRRRKDACAWRPTRSSRAAPPRGDAGGEPCKKISGRAPGILHRRSRHQSRRASTPACERPGKQFGQQMSRLRIYGRVPVALVAVTIHDGLMTADPRAEGFAGHRQNGGWPAKRFGVVRPTSSMDVRCRKWTLRSMPQARALPRRDCPGAMLTGLDDLTLNRAYEVGATDCIVTINWGVLPPRALHHARSQLQRIDKQQAAWRREHAHLAVGSGICSATRSMVVFCLFFFFSDFLWARTASMATGWIVLERVLRRIGPTRRGDAAYGETGIFWASR